MGNLFDEEGKMTEACIKFIKQKKAYGFTDEQIAAELGLSVDDVKKVINEETSEVKNEENINTKETYTIEDTIQDMLSEDYRKRLKAEYGQTKIRYEKLFQYIVDVSQGKREPFESIQLLMIQADAMRTYLTILEVRMNIIGEIQKEDALDSNQNENTEGGEKNVGE